MRVRLNRPQKRNAINAEMFGALSRAAEDAAGDSTIRIVVFEGAGTAFCAGGDIGGLLRKSPGGDPPEFVPAFRKIQEIFLQIESIPATTIASVNGVALGAGLQLALLCDFRISAEEALLGLPDVKNGIIPGLGATLLLPRLIGLAQAKRLVMTGDSIDARTALQIGLVNAVVPADGLRDAVDRFCEKLLRRAPLALAAAKTLLNSGADWAEIAETQSRLVRSRDAQEGIRAFFEKRRPHFTGS